MSRDLSAQGPLAALKMALSSNPLGDGLIHHSDRGVQYCCDEYVKLLNRHETKISMTEKGDPLENALAERVNGILKTRVAGRSLPTGTINKRWTNYYLKRKEVAMM